MTTTPPTGNPAEPTRPIPMTPTQPPAAPGPPPGPPSGPPPSPGAGATPPPSPGATPRKRGGGGLLLVGFIAVSVLLIAALVFAIFSFIGKNDESDKKDKAQKELTSTKKELEKTKAELGTSEAAGGLLGDLLTTGARSADDLKACADASSAFNRQFVAAVGQIVSGGGIPPELQTAASDTDSKCATANQSYDSFIESLRKVRTGNR
jgi:hypothetical protein